MMELIRKHSPTFSIIIETQIGFHKTKSFLYRVGYVSVHYMDARGQSEGIWVLKNNGSNIVIVAHDVFMDIITIKLSLGTSSWYVTRIYASSMYTYRLDIWLHLIDQRNTIDGPWMLIWDFNDIIHPSEQKELILIILGKLICWMSLIDVI